MAESRRGDAQFCFTQMSGNFLIFTHVVYPLLHWKVWFYSSLVYLQLLGHNAVRDTLLYYMTCNVRISLGASQDTHI